MLFLSASYQKRLQKAFAKPLERFKGHLNPQMMMEVTSFGMRGVVV